MTQEQFILLYEAISYINNAKNIEDKFKHEIQIYKNRISVIVKENLHFGVSLG